MLSDRNIRQINRQIEDELRTAGRSWNTDEERAAALDRVKKLKSILDDTPAPENQDAADELAEGIRNLIGAFKR